MKPGSADLIRGPEKLDGATKLAVGGRRQEGRQRGQLPRARSHEQGGRGNQRQTYADQLAYRRQSKFRELQASDLFLLRWTRSLPTINPGGPTGCLPSYLEGDA